jgi:hypothetical protein
MGTAFCAVTVHDVGTRLGYPAHDMSKHTGIAWSDMAPHRKACKAKRQRRRQLAQSLFSPRSACRAVGNQADAMPARNLFTGQVENVTKKAADRGAKYMQDIQRRHRRDSRISQVAARDHGKQHSCIARILAK